MNKSTRIFALLILITCLSSLAGCAKERQYQTIEKICLPKVTKAEAMPLVEDVLSKTGFTIEKADIDRGFIKTCPLSGAQFIEFWRKDNVGSFNHAEANLHSLRRTARLNMNQQGSQLCIDCNIKVQRLSLSEREISNTSQAMDMFSPVKSSGLKLDFSTTGSYTDEEREIYWIDMPDDPKLATYILNKIKKKLEQ